MAIDGLFLYNIQQKLNAYTPCKIGKIQNINIRISKIRDIYRLIMID